MRRSLLRLSQQASHHAHAAGGVGSAPHIHEPAPFYRYSAIALGATTWFWILYKAKNEGAVLLVRPHHPDCHSCLRVFHEYSCVFVFVFVFL